MREILVGRLNEILPILRAWNENAKLAYETKRANDKKLGTVVLGAISSIVGAISGALVGGPPGAVAGFAGGAAMGNIFS